jgi:hypothetical protein
MECVGTPPISSTASTFLLINCSPAGKKKQMIPSPYIYWETLSLNLQNLRSDVLVLLSSCDSAAAIAQKDPRVLGKRMEIITACGCQGVSHGNSFGGAIIEQLGDRTGNGIRDPFKVSSLYSSILEHFVRLNSRDPRFRSDKGLWECPTPVYINLSQNLKATSTELKSFKGETGVDPISLESLLITRIHTFESKPSTAPRQSPRPNNEPPNVRRFLSSATRAASALSSKGTLMEGIVSWIIIMFFSSLIYASFFWWLLLSKR